MESIKIIMRERNFKVTDVPADGNCFFYALSLGMYGTMSEAFELREKSANEVNTRREYFEQFLYGEETMDTVVQSLSTDKTWADNMAIQAASDALSVTIEIVNSDYVSYAGKRIVVPSTGKTSEKYVVLGQLGQAHYVIGRPFFQIDFPKRGGDVYGRKLKNTGTVDGPLFWLMATIESSQRLQTFLDELEDDSLMAVFKRYKSGPDFGRLEWFKIFSGRDIHSHGNISFDRNETKSFFEPWSKTQVASFSVLNSCTASCRSNKLRVQQQTLKVHKASVPLIDRIIKALNTTGEVCSECFQGNLTTTIKEVPPFIVMSAECINSVDEIPLLIKFDILENSFTFALVLITIKDAGNDKLNYVNYFRCNSPDWFYFDGLKDPPVSFGGDMKHIENRRLTFLVYLDARYVSGDLSQSGSITVDNSIIDSITVLDSPKSKLQMEIDSLKSSFDASKFMSFLQSKEKTVLKSFQSSDESDTINLDYETKYHSFELAKDVFQRFCDYSSDLKALQTDLLRTKFTYVFAEMMGTYFND